MGSYEYDEATKALTIKIVQNLYTSTQYTISVTDKVKDRAGNAIMPVVSIFSTDVCPKAMKSKPAFDGEIKAIAKSGCSIYVGGGFTSVGEAMSYGVALDTNTGQKAPSFKYEGINGMIYAVAPDGQGGWYIGGDFTRVGNHVRHRLAHISASGAVLPWNPGTNNTVYTIAVAGSVVYVGGLFTTIGGHPRNYLGAIGKDDSLLPWNPHANNWVRTIAVSSSTVYVGGDFTTIGCTSGCSITPAQGRNHLAAFGADGSLLPWNPNVTGWISSLAIYDTTVYVGGSFNSISGIPRNNLAAIGTDGNLNPWNPNANNLVWALFISGSTIYVGGNFTCFGNCPGGTEGSTKWTRGYLAAFNVSGSILPWNPTANSTVRTIAASDSKIYVGGGFTCFGNCPVGTEGVNKWTRNYLAAIGTDGAIQTWNPNANGQVYALAVLGSIVNTGGTFTALGSVSRNYLAMIGTDGTLSSWNPNANYVVNALAVSGATVYVGGAFTSIGGNSRVRLAAIGTDGSLQAWNPNANHTVEAIAISDPIVYVAGEFTSIGCTSGCSITPAQPRNRLAAITSGGGLQTWNPNADSLVRSIAISGSILYAGGSFTTVGSNSRNRLAAISIDNSCLTAYSSSCLLGWNPNASGGSVTTLAVSGSTVYVGGGFSAISGHPRSQLAAITTAGTLLPWNFTPNGLIETLVVSGSTVYVGGGFTMINSLPRNRLAALAVEGTLLPWNPNADTIVSALSVSGSTIYGAGNFTSINGNPHIRLSSINSDGTVNW